MCSHHLPARHARARRAALTQCRNFRLGLTPPSLRLNGHIHHVIITLIVFVVFTIFPIILLLLYPLKCFHKLWNRTPVRWHALHTFVDVFQGGYKDGFDHGTKDYRLFSALFIIRIFYFAIYGVTLSTVFFIYAAMVSVVVAVLLIILQPFKREKDSYY